MRRHLAFKTLPRFLLATVAILAAADARASVACTYRTFAKTDAPAMKVVGPCLATGDVCPGGTVVFHRDAFREVADSLVRHATTHGQDATGPYDQDDDMAVFRADGTFRQTLTRTWATRPDPRVSDFQGKCVGDGIR